MKMYSKEILSSTILWKECQQTSSYQASTALISSFRNGTLDSNNSIDLWVQ
jgi:hypothetical protein